MRKTIVAIIFFLIQILTLQVKDIPVFAESNVMQQPKAPEVIMVEELRYDINRDLRPLNYKRTVLETRSNKNIDEEPVIEEKYVIDVTEEEIFYLEALVCAEIGDLPEEEQIATAATIVNRVQSSNSDFAKITSITDAITQKNQYSTVKEGKVYKNKVEVTQEMISEVTKNAVQKALKGEDPTEELLIQKAESLGLNTETYVANGATFYYAPKWCSEKAMIDRENIKVKVQYGEHIYYSYWDR